MTDFDLREQLGHLALQLRQTISVVYAVQKALDSQETMPEDVAGAMDIIYQQLESVSDGLGRFACLKITTVFESQ